MKKFIFYKTTATGLYHASVKIKLEPGAKYKKIPVPAPDPYLFNTIVPAVEMSGRKRFVCTKESGAIKVSRRIGASPSVYQTLPCDSETALMSAFFAQAIEIPD